MNKTMLIFKHEFRTLVRRTGFILMTVAFPLLGLLAIGGGELISGIAGGDDPGEVTQVTIGYVDDAGLIGAYDQQTNFTFESFTSVEAANQALVAGDIAEYIYITPDYLQNGSVARFTVSRELETPGDRYDAIRNFVLRNLLGPEADPDIVDRAVYPLNLSNIVIDPVTGLPADTQGGFSQFILPYIFAILLVMSIFTSSGYLLQGLAEEKENRVMEILLSSVSSRQLITGKVLGLGAAGLLQMAVWLISARFLANMASENFSEILGTIEVSTTFVIIGLAYFILGYLLFAIIMAAAGSIGSNARESQQMATVFTLLAVSPMWGMVFLIENPDHPVSIFLTLFPLTAPITTIVRIGVADVPLWQIGLSMLIMALSVVGLLFLAAKIFRTFLLMYGKTPKLGEIIRLIRQS
ncbi:MAG: ABC transporter permease [Dehalogenimonas sp.]|uniref:ABC transporter permease n=1 Tax=Candidatus Dehalogenimonas loeffleri TaxID=3127115 RepID=A0ABZ2J9V4_9CHLR|nr:ABC transporter permease [Dehalogenimonas sp.]